MKLDDPNCGCMRYLPARRAIVNQIINISVNGRGQRFLVIIDDDYDAFRIRPYSYGSRL